MVIILHENKIICKNFTIIFCSIFVGTIEITVPDAKRGILEKMYC